MGVVDGFLSLWSAARATMGEGTPQGGERFDRSRDFRHLQTVVESAKPEDTWTGSGADAYADANAKLARVLGGLADLDERLRAEVDRSAEVVRSGRGDLENTRHRVLAAASAVKHTPRNDPLLYAIVREGAGEVVETVNQATGDLQAIADRLDGLAKEYEALGNEKLGLGPGDDEIHLAVGDGDEPWQYPWSPPPPSDSAPGGGHWAIDYSKPYPSGPGGGPPTGPIETPPPWGRIIEPPITAGTSTFQEVVAPPPNGWGVKPGRTLQEAYRFRVIGERFTGSAEHVRWIQHDGNWYQAAWVSYDFEVEHQYRSAAHNDAAGFPPITWTNKDWEPIGIKEIYEIQSRNPRLPLYVPNPSGGSLPLPVGQTSVVLPR